VDLGSTIKGESSLESELRWPRDLNKVPKEVFVREDVYRAELLTIFYGPQWHGVAHESEIPDPGDFKTFQVGEVPLLINRDKSGKVNVFTNVCTHRGTQLEMAERGNKLQFQCPFHRWTFDASGQLTFCPMKGEGFSPGFSYDKYPLQRLRVSNFKGIIFVTFDDDAPDFDMYLGKTGEVLAGIVGGDGRLKLIGYHKTRFECNWKTYQDVDSYHAPLLHKAFAMFNWTGGREGVQHIVEPWGHISSTSVLTLPQDGGRGLLRDPSLLEFRGLDPKNGSRVVKMFPMFSATKHLDVINLRFANPIGVNATEVHYAYFSHQDDDEEMVRHRIRQSSNLTGPSGCVSLEDAAVFHRQHIGSRSPGSVAFQKGVQSTTDFNYGFSQKDEASNLFKWEYYRSIMGFERNAQ
jgi:anthranilate 1,2-dioxygenase large subunit